jgi:hypothetical protein
MGNGQRAHDRLSGFLGAASGDRGRMSDAGPVAIDVCASDGRLSSAGASQLQELSVSGREPATKIGVLVPQLAKLKGEGMQHRALSGGVGSDGDSSGRMGTMSGGGGGSVAGKELIANDQAASEHEVSAPST